ncbi:uncharacterized protein RHIMIDRAFT_232887 [Rhizopus microsporus ATCC 52813]|uniref:Kinase-like protein n=1 Tax=Rhizopus microsporus ATCC 52813 TaxID=1340429 RepID=A0A2G4T8Y0_RHIZD|nr:uncharacterized protein RHIMIDRAFT_232887 [Rhizopus microsporus ATCC 52813]PHZ17458.1 hypothetical protein RHIMIDRAFT_232887 [Rhizopus microsporus ATCC 52813]
MFLSRSLIEELDDPLGYFEQKIANQVKKNDPNLAKIILEKAIHTYKHDPRYQNNPRYLKLWLIYIFDLSQDKRIATLELLINHRISHKLALLYEAVAHEQIQQNRLNDAHDSLLLGLKNNAIPTKRLRRAYEQFKSLNWIDFDQSEYTLLNYSNEYNNHALNDQHDDDDNNDDEHLLLYDTTSYFMDNKNLLSQLNWLRTQLEHYARASILREIDYSGREISVEELRVKHNPAMRIKPAYRHHPLILTHKKLLNQPKPATQPKPMTQSNPITQSAQQITSLAHVFRLQPPSPSHEKPSSSGQQQKSLCKTPPVLEQEIPQTTAFEEELPLTDIKVVVLPHSPAFVQEQINKTSARQCSNYHVIKDTAFPIHRALSSWFIYDKKKNLWRPSAKKEKESYITLRNDRYLVLGQLGEGGMAQVYLVQHNQKFYALKVQQPPCPWEYYIHHQMRQRRVSGLCLLPIVQYYYYSDTSFLLIPYVRHGTLLEAYNQYTAVQKVMPEPIVLLFTGQFMQQVFLLHNINIAHNDLKLDNIMLITRSEGVMPAVVLIDFGYSVDMTVIKGSKCKATWPPACPQSGYPFLNTEYNPIYADYWEIAAGAHRLLFGEPMRTIQREGKFVIRQKIKRYWHADLWSSFFEFLLNPHKLSQNNTKKLLSEFKKVNVPNQLINECIQLLCR